MDGLDASLIVHIYRLACMTTHTSWLACIQLQWLLPSLLLVFSVFCRRALYCRLCMSGTSSLQPRASSRQCGCCWVAVRCSTAICS